MTRDLFRVSLIALGVVAQALAQNPATSVSVDANANRHAISPNIYGICYGDAHDMATLNATVNRWGGNSTTRYNWQIDAHSAAADWYFETYSDGSGTAGGSADGFVATTRSASNGAEPMITIPMIDYLAKLGSGRSTLAGFSVKKYGAQTGTDPWNSDAGNGISAATGHNITGNNPLDTGVANTAAIQQAWVQHFVSTYGAATSATGVKYYILDNEPSLWYSTHRDVHPNPETYDELYAKIVAYATAIRAADPNAKIAGPEEWSWWAMYFSGFDQANGSGAANSDYTTHAHTYYYPWLLQKLNTYRQQTGVQLVDILTVHPYNGTPDGGDDSLAGQKVRNRETRILWDPSFQDPSWYGDIGINGRILNWIPTLKAMVTQYCPGLQIGCTEYNWGDEAHLNGATTQADVLGIYGREGVDLATRWTVAKDTSTTPTTYYVTYLASQIYRNYDGSRSTFGDTSVSAAVANPDNLSAFASVRTADGALTVMVINKQQGSTPVTVNLANFAAAGTAQAWQINSESQKSIAHLADVAVTGNAIATTVPSQSITLFVVPPAPVAPVITSQPASQIVTVGDPATFTVAASGTPAPTYQWRKNGANISGATGTTYTIASTSTADAGTYTVVATNSAGSATSTGAVLTVNPVATLPVFTNEPVSQTVTVGQSVTFTITASGVPAPTYQWKKNGTDIGGATGATYTIASAALMDAGTYTVLATNSAGSATSAGATFTVKVAVPPPHISGDFNGDGQADIVWQNSSTGERKVSLMNGTAPGSEVSLGVVSTAWQIAGVADFNGDGQTDILFQNTQTGERGIWLMIGTYVADWASLGTIPVEWQIAAAADFNGDGKVDVLWENTNTGERKVWLMNGTTRGSEVSLGVVSTAWQIAGAADFNGDGQTDILWQNTRTGERGVWLMIGTNVADWASLGTVPVAWRMVDALDLNGDGKIDILWENAATGARKVWLMNGTTMGTEVSLGVMPTAWHLGRWGILGSVVRTAVDFNGDGQSDILWQNASTGERKVWLMNGTAPGSEVSLGVVSTAWQIAAAADFNGDGQTDILFENTQTGERGIWLMIGTNVADWASLGTMPVAWRIATVGDFNGDGKVDLLLENPSTGERKVRLMNDTTLGSEVSLGVVSTAWQIAGAADFNGDGQTDILWQNTHTGERGVWVMIGTDVADWASLGTVSTDWQIAGTGDYDGDGQPDILWQNSVTGQRKLWLMHGTTKASEVSLGTIGTDWSIKH